MNDYSTVKQFLIDLGVRPVAAEVYLELSKNTTLSLLRLSANLGISRTQTYRLLAQLEELNLISTEYHDGARHYYPMPIENIETILLDRRAELERGIDQLGVMSQLLRDLGRARTGSSSTVHYYGMDGIKQANWNLSRARNEYRVFEIAPLADTVESRFERRLHDRLAENRVVSYDITNRREVRLDVAEADNPGMMRYCYIAPEILSVGQEIYIYNDIVTILEYNSDDMQAIEIKNPRLHDVMLQMHKVIWNLGRELKLTRDGASYVWK